MSLAQNKIISKLQAIEEYLGYLKDLQKINKKSFLSDYHAYGLAEHYLHLSIEAVLDVAKLIIVNYGFPRPEEPRDTIHILFDKKVVNKKLYDKLSGITGFRNILVHEYEKIDKEIVYNYLQKNIEQFMDFKKSVVKFLGKVRR